MMRKFFTFLLLSLVLNIVFAGTAAPLDDDEDEDDFDEDLDSTEIGPGGTSSGGASEADDDGRIYKNPRNSPSVLCPRDEDQATLLGQKCLRKCSSDEDCKSKKKKCLCDGACGMSCIKPDRECPDLSDPELGHVTITGKLFGDRASYSCQHGYHVVGLQSRTCQADGQWAGQQPACKQNIYCLEPPNIDHARHNALPEQTTFDLDSTLQYYCHTGYVTNGFPRAKCLAIDGQASWYGPDITCEPRSCGPPNDISHGWHAGECYTYGCRVSYHCADGFELVGKSERFCQADGTWSPKELPTCVLVTAVQCAPPENPRNGKAIYTSCSYNSVVSYECKYGYTLIGEGTRRCGADRKWTGVAPVCKEINCGHPGRLWNGWLENIEAGTGLGASIIFRCHDGMKLEGHTSTVCQIDGTWRYPLPKCHAPCVVPQVSQGRVILLLRSNDSTIQYPSSSTVVQHGESLTVECQDQYEFPMVNHTPVTCNNGTWTLIPRCEPARCKHMPKPPKNGMVIAPKTDHGMRAKFRCKDGYTLRGSHFVECSFGNWTGEIPYCQEVYCPFPGYIDNGKVLLVGNMGLYDYRPYVRKVVNNKQIMYDCDKGYVLLEGPPGATCIGGHWSPKDLPRCVPGQHPRLRWSRRRRSVLMNRYRQKLLGPRAVYLYQRRRRALAIKENKVNLNDLFKTNRHRRSPKPKMGTTTGVRQPQNNLKNLRRTNNENRRQNAKGRKKGLQAGFEKEKVKVKNRSPCEDISTEPYVNVEIVKQGKDPNITFSAGTIVRVACGKGYGLNLEVNTTAKCVKGRWKPQKPVCSVVPCYVPLTPNGFYKLSTSEQASSSTILFPSDTNQALNETTDVLNGQVVEFSCSPGYNIQGPSNLRCWLGEWTVTSFPRCHAAPCQLPQINHGQYLSGYRAGLMIANGSSVTFQCDSDYSKSTAQPVECILGELYPKSPECKESPILNSTPEGPHYLGGSDIIKGGDISVLDFRTGLSRACGPPARVQGSLIYRDGEPIVDDERSFPDGTEVTFHCIESIMGEKTTWRIICEDGSWIGRSLNCDAEELMTSSFINNNNTCTFRNQEPNVVSFYNDQQIREDIVEFPPGAVLVSRCIDIGKYAMIGSNKRRCIGGEWDGQKPSCFGLNQENDYAMEKPPTILFRHQNGPIAQSNDGKLIVYPGTIVHMECLWIRRFGNPKWNVSHDYRKYPEGWTADDGRDPQLEYRLSIYHAAKDDTGIFTCVTPARQSHSVDIIVKAVHCPIVPQRRGLTVNSESTKMNTKLQFSCINGNSLIGAPEITCLPSGNWSAPFPICESIECGEVGTAGGSGDLGPHLRVSLVSREVGGRAVFSCTPGYGLRGPHETICLSSGEWATPFPTCAEVQCDIPGIPENGYMQGSGPFKAGDVVQFNCNPDFMMEGQPIIACQDNSRWSGPLPKCVQACSYPGTTISGRMSAVKFFYKIGENITFTCDEGLTLRGAAMLKCLRNGKWSNAIPTCITNNTTTTSSR